MLCLDWSVHETKQDNRQNWHVEYKTRPCFLYCYFLGLGPLQCSFLSYIFNPILIEIHSALVRTVDGVRCSALKLAPLRVENRATQDGIIFRCIENTTCILQTILRRHCSGSCVWKQNSYVAFHIRKDNANNVQLIKTGRLNRLAVTCTQHRTHKY